MRLHRLEITAFGPFAAHTVIDFETLGADGLFLLHGQTGAGKTTVLDAIAFALYGRVPGARAESKRLHSDHADPTTAPRVQLEATLGGRHVRLIRTPEFQRPSTRAKSGFVKENAAATLEWLDGRGVNLSRLPDIGEEIVRLLGMSADQFFQVVLLPQGDFARFLRADNEDREKLLEKLFDTQRFGVAERWLADRSRASEAALRTRSGAIERLVDKVAMAAGRTGAEVVEFADAVGWSQRLLAEAEAAAATTTAESERCEQQARALSAHAEQQRRYAESRQRLARARVALDAYTERAPHRADIAAELDAANRAEPVAQAVEEAREVVRDSRRRDAAFDTAAGALLDALTDPRAADLDPAALLVPGSPPALDPDADLDLALRGLGARMGVLDEARGDVETAARLERELTELRRERTRSSEAITALVRRRDELPLALAAADERVREAATAVATLPALADELARLETAATAAVDLTRRRLALDRARVDFETARTAHNDARERALTLRERRLRGMAAELAGALLDGTPCAVCGSPEHPEPARPGAEAVSEAEEGRAAAAERAAEGARDRVRDQVVELEREIEGLRAAGGDADPAELAAARRTAADRHTDAAALAASAPEFGAALAGLRADEARLADEMVAAETHRSAVTTRIAAAEQRAAELADRLAVAAGLDGDIAARRRRLESLITRATAYRQARDLARAGQDRVTVIAERVRRLASAAGLPETERSDDPIEVLTAHARLLDGVTRTPVQRTGIETELREAEEIRVRAEAVLADPEIVAAAAAEPEDLAAIQQRLAEAERARDGAVAARHQATVRVEQLRELGGQLWAALERIGPEQRAHDELSRLAQVVAGRGENSRSMSLRSYVLAARLEEVAVAGSVRLRRMSGGRYEFVHSDRAGRHGRRGGLGLDIRDDYTGHIRPANTLSGGETFMASLSLALGLADTVAAETGGKVLDTLFIDEGFGSLDADTLDAVMGVLDELRAGGRVVGLVSHVDEMRQRIPTRLHVVRGRTGSHLRTTVA